MAVLLPDGTDLRRSVRVQRAVAADPAAQIALRQQIDDPGAADPLRSRAADRLIMQAVFRIDPHAAHRARLRPHSGPADRALQRRPGGSGPRKQVFPAPERQLSVRSDVEENRGAVSGVQICQQEAGRDIAAQIVGHRRHTENIAVKRQSQLTCGMHARIEKDRRIGALEDLPRFAAEQQMHHRRVSRSAQRRDLLRLYSRLLTALRDQAADALQHQLL